ncbi:MAG: ABC transporter permease [Steroidobacteraceae bacterium]
MSLEVRQLFARQSRMLSWTSLAAVPTRPLSSLIAIVGFAGVSSMLIIILSGRHAIAAMYALGGREDIAIVIAGNASYEGLSLIPRSVELAVERMPGIARLSGGPAISKELVSNGATRLMVGDDPRAGPAVISRGVTPRAFEIRPQLRIVAGRGFRTGTYEVIVGRALARQYGLRLGSKVRLRRATLEVVGIFESAGSVAETEVWLDKGVLQSLLFTSGGTQATEQTSVLWVQLVGPDGLSRLQQAVATSKLDVMKGVRFHAESERQFLRAQSGDLLQRALKAAIAVGLVMGIGALFGAINTMYGVVAQRSREIATLRALGFQSFAVAISVIVEALALALAGGLLGAAIAAFATHDLVLTIYNSGAEEALALQFLPSANVILVALGYVLVLGGVSSLLPCIRALRCPIPVGLFAR